MGMLIDGQAGPQKISDGSRNTVRLGNFSEVITQDAHGRFYEQTLRGNEYSIGMTTLAALTANTATLTATTTPIVGVWNPLNSPVNLVILQAMLAAGINAAAATGPGIFAWASSIGNGVITAGSAPFNRKTLQNSGSQAKGFQLSGAVALTGLTNNLVIFEPGDFQDPTVITTAAVPTSVQTPVVQGVQNFDGSLIVPPGGVLALVNTVSTTTISVFGRLLWEEVPF